ncbi:hypothetical protein FOMPIDRAFT_1049601 [Fomitopsis schrenkii]|uniref:Fungal-type protein kinase domain-containing protein n=1 Tax=Fomitopsis schrenkii TaxID=2126942 RepID=S8EB99_FOMSC|nr:hypothetical protein FOMPIDRAFT_1049601 [Fomitopsis schrenkii]
MARRSKAHALRSRRRRLPTSYHDCSQTASHSLDPDEMSDKVSPRKEVVQKPSNLADVRQRSEKSVVAWTTQIFKRIVEPTDDIDKFLHEFAPSTSRPRTKCPVDRFPGDVPAESGQEPRMYAPLIAGLKELVENFPVRKRPSFTNHANKVMKFPFAHMCDDETYETKPDIVASIPQLLHLAPRERWRNVAFIFEVKAVAGDDPMRQHTLAHEKTLIQLANSARNIMLAQGCLYAFTIGIYGHKARIFRFDHAGAVCSPLFDYILRPNILYNFMWRFLHPIDKACRFLGDDPTSVLGTPADRALVRAFALKHDPLYKHTAEIQKAVRRITLIDDENKKRQYLAYKLIFVNPGLFSRATTIWEAVELDETGKKTVGGPVVIKDAWRQFIRPSELRNYEDMHEAVAEDVALSLTHIADFAHGDDLGLRETKKLFRDGHAVSILDGKPFAGSVDDLDEDEINKFRFPAASVFGHRTVSASCRTTAGPEYDRGHVRLVLKSVGKPITDFDSTYEMVTALRDAIMGHEEAYKAGMIHRDVSRGNVMIVKKPDGSTGGFLHDFDYASSWMRFLKAADLSPELADWVQYAADEYLKLIQKKKGGATVPVQASDSHDSGDESRPKGMDDRRQKRAKVAVDTPQTPPPRSAILESKDERVAKMIGEQKQRTGTLHFMAVEIHVNDSTVTHEARHDLESFFWLLVWLVLRHTTYECLVDDYKEGTWHALFDGARMVDCRNSKQAWLAEPFQIINIEGNTPLTNLLEDFRVLCKSNYKRVDLGKPWMTHADVLRLFNKALARPQNWPQGDKAEPWLTPATQFGSILGQAGSGKPRSKGTLTYTSASQDQEASHRPSADAAVPRDADEDETDSESDVEKQDVPAEGGGANAKGKGKAPARKLAPQATTGPRGARQTSITMSHASGSHESPPSSNPSSVSNGSEPAQMHPSGYDLRLPKKSTEELRGSARSKVRSMGPPPVPRNRSGTSQSQSSSRPAAAGPSLHGARVAKRSRTPEDEEEEGGAGTSHSPKRPRTLSQHGPENAPGSRKAKGKKRAS